MRVLDLQHRAGVEHVLRRRPEMDVFAVFRLAQILHGFQRGHQRMLDAADLGGDRLDVDVRDFRFRRDFVRRGAGDDAERGLLQRQRRFEVVPFLHAVRVAEYRLHSSLSTGA